ncbi:MAG TPA: YbaB/EbfC family nucleoid-associated protein [Negativicutes bacterium]|nr:YbaB/EbfC family nucleoid-associated protein [Negativicutes bacterium]
MFGGNAGNMAGMMKKVQKMQADMAKLQEELKQRTLEVTAGGGAIKVVISGDKDIRSLKIAPEAIDPEDIEMLEDMLIAAFNEAVKKVDEMTSTEMGKLTGGLNLPKGML